MVAEGAGVRRSVRCASLAGGVSSPTWRGGVSNVTTEATLCRDTVQAGMPSSNHRKGPTESDLDAELARAMAESDRQRHAVDMKEREATKHQTPTKARDGGNSKSKSPKE